MVSAARWALARCSVFDGVVVPRYLTARDHPRLRALIDEFEAFAGRPLRVLNERLRDPAGDGAADARWPSARRLAIEVLQGLFGTRVDAVATPRDARAAVFRVAADRRDRASVLLEVARSFGISAEQVARSLLADLPEERVLGEPAPWPTPDMVALLCNLRIQQSVLMRSSAVTIEMEGNARVVVRHAKFRGLICTVSSGEADAAEVGARLRLSGPLSLFRRTTLYGRALAELVPLLAWCRRFRLTATCELGERSGVFVLRDGDPICPAVEPRRYDSRLEKQFAREFPAFAPEWELVREPEPLPAGATLVFPDFLVRHRSDPSRRWLLEIVGFWKADYLRAKLARLRAARLDNLILCIDRKRDCGRETLPPHGRVVRFDKRIDPADVVRVIESR